MRFRENPLWENVLIGRFSTNFIWISIIQSCLNQNTGRIEMNEKSYDWSKLIQMIVDEIMNDFASRVRAGKFRYRELDWGDYGA